MKPLFYLVFSVCLAACGGASNTSSNASDVQAASSSANDAAEVSLIRQNFTQACVDAAMSNSASQAANPEKLTYAERVCNCVYEQGVQAYGGDSEKWDEAIKQGERQADAQLQQTTSQALQTCLQQHTPSPAKASESASAAQ